MKATAVAGAAGGDRKARVLDAARAQPSPTRGERRVREAIGLGAALCVSLAVFVALGALRAEPRPGLLVAGTAAGAAAVALVTAWLAFGRGGSMLGRPGAWLAAAILAAPVVLFAWKVGVSAAFAGMSVPWPSRIGLRCLGLSLAMGVWPVAAAVWLRRGTEAVRPGLGGAALGAAAGALSWTLVDLWCPVAYVPHLMLGHVLPFAVLAAFGAVLGRRFLAVRAVA